MKNRHLYKEPDVSKRTVSDRFGDGRNALSTKPSGLYNPHLTIGELCLIRTLIWEIRDSMGDNYDYHFHVLPILHKWLFAEEAPELPIYLDIKNAFEKGVNIDFEETEKGE